MCLRKLALFSSRLLDKDGDHRVCSKETYEMLELMLGAAVK